MKVTRAMRTARTVDPRVLQLKIRIQAPAGTTREQLLHTLETAIATGTLPDGWAIHWIDWRKGTGGTANSGTIRDDALTALKDFWLAIRHSGTEIRVERAQ